MSGFDAARRLTRFNSVPTAHLLPAGAAALVGLGVGAWIAYLFKKSKVKESVKAEIQKEMDKLKEYELLNKLIEKKAKLEGRETWNIEYPALAKSSDSEQ